MRMIFIGASTVSCLAASRLIEKGFDVVIVEQDATVIDELSATLDCGFIHGDGSRPAILEELEPGSDDMLFCLSNSDQDNIIASAVGQSLKFGTVVTKVEDPDFEPVCAQLGLDNVLVPDRQVAEQVCDFTEGQGDRGSGVSLQGELRFFTFHVDARIEGPASAIELPPGARIIVVSREGESALFDAEKDLREGDELILLTARRHLGDLSARYGDGRHDKPNGAG